MQQEYVDALKQLLEANCGVVSTFRVRGAAQKSVVWVKPSYEQTPISFKNNVSIDTYNARLQMPMHRFITRLMNEYLITNGFITDN